MLQAAALYATVSVAGAGQSVAQLKGVSGAVDATQKQLSILGLKSQGIGKGIRQVAGGLVKIGEVVGLGFLAATAASAKFATTFQANMELIHTQANAKQSEVDSMTKAVQDMVHAVGTTPEELAKGLYHIESVGLRGAEALDVLKASALAAKLGLADMESVANALSGVKFSRISGGQDPMKAVATLDAIIGQGNMRMQDLVDSFSTGILGTSKTFGVGLRDMGAALAVLTDAAVPAQVAATRMQMMLTHMAAPVPGAVSILKKLGLDKFQLSNDLTGPDGIYAALTDLRAHLEKVGELKGDTLSAQGKADVAKLFGGSRFGAAAMQLIAVSDRVKTKYDAIGASQDTFGEKVTATMATAGFHWGQFMADLKNDAISFGTGTLPALIRGLDRLDTFVVAHRADAVKLGQDVGGAIDQVSTALSQVDWSSFSAGLKTATDFGRGVIDVLKTIIGISPQADVAFAGLVGVDKLSGGLLGKGFGNIGGSILGQFVGRGSRANPMWVQSALGVGGVGPGAGGVGGKLGSVLQIAGTVAITAASIYALAQQFQTFMSGVGQNQLDLQGNVDATKTQTTQQSIDNLNNTITGLNNMPVWDRLIANTYGGAQITQDITDAAARLANAPQTPAQLAQSRIAVQAALDYAKSNFGTAAMQPFIADLAKIDKMIAAQGPNASGGPDDRGSAYNPLYTLPTAGYQDKLDAVSIAVQANTAALAQHAARLRSLFTQADALLGITHRDAKGHALSGRTYLQGVGSPHGKDAVLAADAITGKFQTYTSPYYKDPRNEQRFIDALTTEQKYLIAHHDTTDAKLIGQDIAALKANMASKADAAANAAKAAKASTDAGSTVAVAIRDRGWDVSITPQPIVLKLDGKLLASGIVQYTTTDNGNTGGGVGPRQV